NVVLRLITTKKKKQTTRNYSRHSNGQANEPKASSLGSPALVDIVIELYVVGAASSSMLHRKLENISAQKIMSALGFFPSFILVQEKNVGVFWRVSCLLVELRYYANQGFTRQTVLSRILSRHGL